MKKLSFLLVLLLLWTAPALGATEAGDTYYEVFVRSFYDSDGDGPGDLPGLLARLDTLSDGDPDTPEDLSVDGLWLMPIMPSPSYHKYDVVDYRAVDPEYGTLEDFEALAAACRARGMGLLIDAVFNHTSSEHPWFLSALKSLPVEPCGQAECAATPLCREHNPYVGYYHFTQAPAPADAEVPALPGWYYRAGFGPHMPDLDLSNETVRAELLEICAFWLEKGATGFRLDAVTHYFEGNTAQNEAFLHWLMEGLRAIDPDVYVVAEAWTDDTTIAQLYHSGVPSFFNFGFSDASGVILRAIRGQNGRSFATQVEANQARIRAANPSAIDAVFLSNHDQARSAGALMRDPARQKLAANLYLLMPGNAFIYYGEELGMSGSGRDENKRLPFPWSEDGTGQTDPPPEAEDVPQTILPWEAQRDDPASLLSHYRRLIRLRAAYPAITRGDVEALESSEQGVAPLRFTLDGREVYVVHNLTKRPLSLPWPHGGRIAEDLTGGAALVGETLSLPAWGSVVLVPE